MTTGTSRPSSASASVSCVRASREVIATEISSDASTLGERPRLLDSLRREPVAGHRRGRDPVAVRRREAMPREEQLAHG